jgi:hypothetical protein
MTEAIAFSLLMASRQTAQGKTNDQGDTAQNAMTVPNGRHWLGRRFIALNSYWFSAASHEKSEQHKDAEEL